jgi:transposase InsO family protein
MCRVFSVSRSGYYRWLQRATSQRARERQQLVAEIRRIHAANRAIYGSPRVADALKALGISCGKNRVARLMRSHGIRSRIKRKFKVTTHSRHQRPVTEDLLQQDFTASAPHTKWSSDITYIWTKEGWLYLAVFLDLFTRRIVGWSMSHRMTDELVVDAFQSAWQKHRPSAGLVVHSDRGSQYCSKAFRQRLIQYGCRQSMCAAGNCFDNAITESFFHSLKTEWVYHETYVDRSEARRSVFTYIEMFYNRVRIHSALGGLSPEQFESRAQVA